ncbi:LamG-like jellyroll fold domain-containing protein [Microscilla marina]|nr:LamG-like jellyroll fold domain-containing protein [Microscilla marina]
MNHHKILHAYWFWFLAFMLAGSGPLHAQKEYGILKMHAVNYATYFNTGIELPQVLAQGNAGEASLEFWIRSTFSGNDWELTDMLPDDQSLSLKMTAGNQLHLSIGSQSQSITLNDAVTNQPLVQSGAWHHVMLTIQSLSGQSHIFRIYINGAKRGELLMNLPNVAHRPLFFYRDKNSSYSLEIAEIRAWNTTRTDREVAQNWLRSFAKDELNLSEVTYQGLHTLLGDYSKAHEMTSVVFSELKTMLWDNSVPGAQNMGKGVGSYTKGSTTHTLMEVRNNIEHPILKNETIYLTASKGAYASEVVLNWPHVKGATQYTIYKNDVAFSERLIDASNKAVGDPMTFSVNTNLLPGQIDQYKVQVSQGSVSGAQGTDYGFIFHNGSIAGKVQSSSGVGTPGVAVTFGASTLPGHAMQFGAGSQPLTIRNADVFKNNGLARDFMVEFWYQGSGGNNTVFALGNLNIQMLGNGSIKTLDQHGQEYISFSSPAVTDGQWHHYAVVFSQSGGAIYVDGGKEVDGTDAQKIQVANVSNTTAYRYDNIGLLNNFSLNAQAGATYALDELRIWDADKVNVTQLDNSVRQETTAEFNARLTAQIGKYRPYVIQSDEDSKLLLYYRFDLNTQDAAYNQAATTKGDYIAESAQTLTRVANCPTLKYATYTNAAGIFDMREINYGSGSVVLTIDPEKTNHTFNPATHVRTLKSSTTVGDYSKTGIDFTDESQFSLTGYVYYKEGDTEYPVPAGQAFEFASGRTPGEVDFQQINGSDGQPKATDNFGQFSLSLPIGFQNFRVKNPYQSRSLGAQSLKFDGTNDFAKSEGAFAAPTQGLTWSGWVKRGDFSGAIPALQTLMQIGNVRLVLRDNTYLALYKGNASLAEVPFAGSTDWQFFGFTYDQSTQTLYLYASATVAQTASTTLPASDLGGSLYLGARSEGSTQSEFLKGNLHLIELRHTNYSPALLNNLRTGNYIKNDVQQLKASYLFNEDTKSLRAVSSAAGSQSLSLNLLYQPSDETTMPQYDAAIVNPYTRQYRYEYSAQGAYANEEKIALNVDAPKSGQKFYNNTRYGITGNIIIPCNNSIGLWNVKLERTDITTPAFSKEFTAATTVKAADIFNTAGTVFSVDGLLPGVYKLTLTNQTDNNIVKTRFGIDITKGWANVDIEYRSPLQVAASIVQLLGKDANKVPVWKSFDQTLPANYCSDKQNYILEQQQQYQVRLEFFENYSGNKCYVANTKYYVAGDLQLNHGQLASKTVGSSSSKPFTSESGIDTVIVWSNYPNFLKDPGNDPAKNYSRTLDINATERSASTSLRAWVTGTVQDENQNFTLTYPNVQQVLYDPPGDGSSIKWSSGSTLNSSVSISNNISGKAATKITTGTKHSAYMGAWAGFGGGVVALYESSTGSVTAGGKIGTSHSVKIGNSSSYSLSFDKSISTSSGISPLPGAQSDVFIGTSDVVYIGSGNTVSVDGCTATANKEDATASTEPGASFQYSRWTIENTLLPNLDNLIASLRGKLADPAAENKKRENLSVSDRGKVDTIKNYLQDIERWKTILTEATTQRQQVKDGQNNTTFSMSNEAGTKSLPSNHITFGGGGTSTNYTIGENESTTNKVSHSHSLDLTKYFNTNLTIFGFKLNLEIELNLGYEFSRDQEGGSGSGSSISIHLSDNEAEDSFDAVFRRDPKYPTPVIIANAGQSMCPIEPNTVARQGVEIVSANAIGWADLTGEAVFDVTIRNTQKANEAVNAGFAKTYKLKVPSADLPSGASVRVEGLGNLLIPRMYTLEPGESKTLKVYIKRAETTSPTEFANIPLSFYSACDEGVLDFYEGEKISDGQGGYTYVKGEDKRAALYNSDGSEYVRLRDVVKLTAKFHAPCAGSMSVAAPVANWVVNSTANNLLKFRLKAVTPHTTFEKVRLEFALPNSNTIQFAKDVKISDLGNTDSQGYYTYDLDVSAIGADQAYRVRVVPVCGNETEGWQTNTPSEWINGAIARKVPLITGVTPANGATTQVASFSATYDAVLDAQGANPLNVSLRGILGGNAYVPTSAWFDQVADQVTVPDQSALDLADAYTVEFWVKPSRMHSTTLPTPIIEKGSNMYISFIQGNKIYAGQGDAISTQTLGTDGWTHVAVVFVKGSSTHALKIYLNGVLNKTVSAGINAFTTNNDPLTIGKASAGQGFKGGLDEVRIWSKALDAADIRTHMHKRLLGTENGLQAYYVLDNNALDGEAIRDYTAKTRSTTQTGLSFVTQQQAAPLEIASIIQDIPVTVTTSSAKDQLIIQPKSDYPSELLEGALLTATIFDNAIKDEYGNPAAGKSWTFRVDGNYVSWNKGNHTVAQTTGNGSSFGLTLKNDNASEVQYQLTEIPMWLKVTNNASQSNGSYILPSGNSHPMTFETAAWLSAGTYNGQVKAKISQGATLLGYETVDIKVIVSCDASYLSLAPTSFAHQMSATFSLQKNGQAYADAQGKTVLVRNSAGTLVGKGIVQMAGGNAIASLNIYSKTAADTYTVYLWDDTACQENPIGTGNFTSGGSVNQTLDVGYQGKAQYTVKLSVAGYHWMSFRVSDAANTSQLSLSQITGFGAGDVISEHGTNASKSAVYNGVAWSGSLTALYTAKSYQVQVQAPRTLQLSGYTIDASQPIALTASANQGNDGDNNPLGYTRTDAMTITQALGRMTPDASIGDVITSRAGSAQYIRVDGVGTWVGSLTHLIPNQGYKIKVAQNSSIRYASVGTGSNARIRSVVPAPNKQVWQNAAQLKLAVNPHAYAFAHHITGVLQQGGKAIENEPDYLIVAYANNEVRGMAVPQQIAGKWYYFMTAYSHQEGEKLDFRLVNKANGEAYALSNTLSVQSAQMEGKVDQPYVFRLAQDLQAAQVAPVNGLKLYQNHPNPMKRQTAITYVIPKDGRVTLTVTNALGQRVKVLVNKTQTAGPHEVTWQGKTPQGGALAKGVYFYTLKTPWGTLTKRLTIQ